MRNSMSAGRDTWKRSMLVLTMALTYGYWAPQYTQPGQAPQQASNLEQAIVNLNKIISSTQSQAHQPQHSAREGRFSSQPHQNPKAIHEVEAQEGESSQVREVKVVITLRSGKEVDLPTTKPSMNKRVKQRREEGGIQRKETMNNIKKKDHDSTVNEELERTISKEDMMKNHSPPPFPQALHGKRESTMHQKFLKLACYSALWKTREEILPLFKENEIQEAGNEESPKLILKPLPAEFKYAYLEQNKKCPVVISSSLTTPQEDCLLEVLKRWGRSFYTPHSRLEVCIDYRKLNNVTRNDHFPLPFMDQVLGESQATLSIVF
ncbi:hypothetical protein CK203_049768 [Vitis vinifera]|uniref:Reverse transcriptase RNase H-like domain-containing protein n=1 Tax=Vitis vinifera TaxID=29760 RepID=A0A438H239_VITVI|nr:hypothetical protein CK203_049768 [Vitis vinifera]